MRLKARSLPTTKQQKQKKKQSNTKLLSENPQAAQLVVLYCFRMNKGEVGSPTFSSSLDVQDFFFCNAGLVLDMVGQLLEMVKTVVNLPGNETKNKTTTPTQQSHKNNTNSNTHKKPRDQQEKQPGRFVN